MQSLLRLFFRFLYHQLAFAYDLVAASVSFGHWKYWILEVVPFMAGTRILELGHGPGHLQRFLLNRGLAAVAIDESPQMGRIAKRNTDGAANLTRGLAQQLPFQNASFDTVIATFPAEYISDAQTLSEVRRCLSGAGRFIVLPVATPRNLFLAWLFRVTGESPSNALQVVTERMEEPITRAGFKVETRTIELKSGTLIIIVSTK